MPRPLTLESTANCLACAFAAATLVVLLTAFYFAQPTADDFAKAANGRLGALYTLRYAYFELGGRWSTNLLQAIVFSRVPLLDTYPLLLIANIVFLGFAIHRLSAALARPVLPAFLLVRASLLFLLIFWTTCEQAGDTFFWLTGGVEYLGNAAIALLFLSSLFHPAPSIATRIGSAILALYLGGSHELIVLALVLLLAAGAWSLRERGDPRARTWLGYALILTLFLTTLIASPGAFHRATAHDGSLQPVRAIAFTAVRFLTDLPGWLFQAPVLFATLWIAIDSRLGSAILPLERGLWRSAQTGPMNRPLHLAPLLLLAAGAAVAETGSFVGAGVCASCHPAQSTRQDKSAHALSLHSAAQHPLAARFAANEWLTREPSFRIRYSRSANGIRAQGYDKENVIDIPVEWAFGAGEQAVTLVTRIDSEWHLEHHFSYYSAIGAMAPTAGHSALQPKTLPEAMGLPYKTKDPAVGILGCFECHSTGPVRISPGNILQPAEAGVRCEACHGPGRLHVQAASRGDIRQARTLIANPKRTPAQEILVKCGQCHRPPATAGTSIDWNYSWNVRHQPVYLAQSKCMTKSAGQLSCLTCHDPHSPLKETSKDTYRERCLACHDGRSARAVPVNGSPCRKDGACATCHMPAVSPQPALRFTNHWIGIYDPAKPLRPRNN